ncbi:hypothetical protein [Azospirillum argentinense]
MIAIPSVVDAEHRYRGNRRNGAGPDAVQQRRAADRHTQGCGVAGAGITAEGQADASVHGAQPVDLARPGGGDP